MVYRGGRGNRRGPLYGQGRGIEGGGRPYDFVWPPPASSTPPVPARYHAAPMVYQTPVANHQASHEHAAPVTIGALSISPLPAPAAATHQAANAPAPAFFVSINPESKPKQTNREVRHDLIKLHGKTSLGGKLPAYDGGKASLDQEKETKGAEGEYNIRIAGRTDMYHCTQFPPGRQRDIHQETMEVLDVVLRESLLWNCVTLSISFFSTSSSHRGDNGEGLECWGGYYQSLRPTQMGLSLNMVSFFKSVTVIKFMEESLNVRDTARPLLEMDIAKVLPPLQIKKAIWGTRIDTDHQQCQIRRYKITGITPTLMSPVIFPVDEKGTRKTIVQYFWDKYGYRLLCSTYWPCLQAGSDSHQPMLYLPTDTELQVCKNVEGQRHSKKHNARQVTNILRATCKWPQEMQQIVHDMVLHNKYAEDKFAQEFGIHISDDRVSVPDRVLPPPLIKYLESDREKVCTPNLGQWNMINKNIINGGIVDNWTCLNFSSMRPQEVQRFCTDLIHMCNATGLAVNPYPFLEIKSADPKHIDNALSDVHRRTTRMHTKQEIGNRLQLLVVILPDNSGSYGEIERVCENNDGILYQCCLPKHASRPNKQYLEDVALKINVKVGKRNTVHQAVVRNGVDVTHTPPASSIAAVVAPMGWRDITKYRDLLYAQPYRKAEASWLCLQAGSDSRPVKLPVEVCKIVEGLR